MPTYEYQCAACDEITEALRRIAFRNEPVACPQCGSPCERVMVTPPTTNPWNAERKFPNLSPHGDGSMTFPSQKEYEMHLKASNIGEKATDAPVYRPHGNKVVMIDGKEA